MINGAQTKGGRGEGRGATQVQHCFISMTSKPITTNYYLI